MPASTRSSFRLPGSAGALALLLTAAALAPAATAAAEPPPAASADVDAVTAPLAPAAAPDGMGHLHAEAGMTAAEGANPHEDGDGDGDACPMMAHHGHHMGLGMHHHPQPVDDAVLAAVAAPTPPAWLADLALTEAQEDRIFEVLHEVAPAQRRAQRTATRTQALLHHGGMATDYNEGETHKIADQHGQAVAELARLAARTERRILDVLTPDQRREAAHRAAHTE